MKHIKRFNETVANIDTKALLDELKGTTNTTPHYYEKCESILRPAFTNTNAMQEMIDIPGVLTMSHFLLFRVALRGTFKSIDNQGEAYLEACKMIIDNVDKEYMEERTVVAKWCCEFGRIEVLKYLMSKQFYELTPKYKRDIIIWCSIGRYITQTQKDEINKYIESL